MKPGDCGTFHLPPDGSPDREAIDAFAQFLKEDRDRGSAQAGHDPAWWPWARNEGPAPSPWHGPAVPRTD